MFSRKILAAGKKLNVKLTAFYAAAFVLGSLILFLASYLSLSSELRELDYAIYRQRLLGYWAKYQIGGTADLIAELSIENLIVGDRPFFVRISTKDGETLLLKTPEQWSDYDFSSLQGLF